MKLTTLGEQRNAFAYYIGMYIIVINEIDTMLITDYGNIFYNGKSASNNFIKKTMADRIKSILHFVNNQDNNRKYLGMLLKKIQDNLWIRNALAHGFICDNCSHKDPAHLILIAHGHEKNLTPAFLRQKVQEVIELSGLISEALTIISLNDKSH